MFPASLPLGQDKNPIKVTLHGNSPFTMKTPQEMTMKVDVGEDAS